MMFGRPPWPWFLALLVLAACDDEGDGAAPLPDAAPDASPRGAADAARQPFFPVGGDAGPAPADAAPPLADARPADPDAAPPPEPDAAPPPEPDAAPPPEEEEGPAIYTADRLVSPLTPWVVDRLRQVVTLDEGLADDVFAKVGASSTVSRGFLHCFAGDNVDLAGEDELWPTIQHFRGGDAAGTDPYTRTSLTATVGWSASHAIAGDPSPLDRELDAIRPRFAVVMYGTNDIQRRDLDGYYGNMLTLVDQLTEQGVIPIVSSVMPRDDDAAADALVPSYNAVVRGVAQGRQVPFVDLHQALVVLPNHGLGPDRLHSSSYRGGSCVFTEEGLLHGYNWRNLLTIRALHGLVETVLGGAPAPDAPHRPQLGTGSADDPFIIEALPFTDLRDTDESPHTRLDRYPGCNAMQDESGPELIYRVDLVREANLRAWVLDRGDVDVDLHLLTDPHDPGTCVQRAHREIRATLGPGTWYFVVDSFTSGGVPKSGEYLFVLIEE